MKKLAKTTLIHSFFLISGLAASFGYAAPESRSNIITKSAQLSSFQVTNSNNYPSLTHIIFDTNTALKPISLSNISNKPLPGIQVADFALISPSKFRNHNSIFEFAVKFNDKLQQILSFFDFSSQSHITTTESNMNKKAKKITLSHNSKNKSHTENCDAG